MITWLCITLLPYPIKEKDASPQINSSMNLIEHLHIITSYGYSYYKTL